MDCQGWYAEFSVNHPRSYKETFSFRSLMVLYANYHFPWHVSHNHYFLYTCIGFPSVAELIDPGCEEMPQTPENVVPSRSLEEPVSLATKCDDKTKQTTVQYGKFIICRFIWRSVSNQNHSCILTCHNVNYCGFLIYISYIIGCWRNRYSRWKGFETWKWS